MTSKLCQISILTIYLEGYFNASNIQNELFTKLHFKCEWSRRFIFWSISLWGRVRMRKVFVFLHVWFTLQRDSILCSFQHVDLLLLLFEQGLFLPFGVLFHFKSHRLKTRLQTEDLLPGIDVGFSRLLVSEKKKKVREIHKTPHRLNIQCTVNICCIFQICSWEEREIETDGEDKDGGRQKRAGRGTWTMTF